MESYLAKGQLILESNASLEIDIDITEFDLGIFELDKAKVHNIRKKSDLVVYLLDRDSEVFYDFPARQKHEVHGGYKRAQERGARLSECQVFNLYFRFRSWLKGDGIALMCRPPSSQQEWIILLPDDTLHRIALERKEYLRDAFRMTVIEQIMDPDQQSVLIENLDLLDVHERCAQSLMHEFGHVLHYRVFDELNITNSKEEQYIWFTSAGYLDNVDLRYPFFSDLHPLDKLAELKESLVEDYRISLNMEAKRGKFILPNKVCYLGDFQLPELLNEGVEIMKKMLEPAAISSRRAKGQSSSDVDSLGYVRKLRQRKNLMDWKAGKPSMTDDVRSRDLSILKGIDAHEQAAATTT